MFFCFFLMILHFILISTCNANGCPKASFCFFDGCCLTAWHEYNRGMEMSFSNNENPHLLIFPRLGEGPVYTDVSSAQAWFSRQKASGRNVWQNISRNNLLLWVENINPRTAWNESRLWQWVLMPHYVFL